MKRQTSRELCAVARSGSWLAVVLAVICLPGMVHAQGGSWTGAVSTMFETASGKLGLSSVIDARDDITVAWFESSAVFAARFDGVTESWSAATQLSAVGASVGLEVPIATDDAGNVTVAWQRGSAAGYYLEVARYSTTTRTWGLPYILFQESSSKFGPPAIAFDRRTGDITLVWQLEVRDAQSRILGEKIQAARYDGATGLWGARVDLSMLTSYGADDPRVVVDDAGNALAVWQSDSASLAARYSATTRTWAPITASLPRLSTLQPTTGNTAFVLYADPAGQHIVRYSFVTNQWSAPADFGSGFVRRLVVDSGGNATFVWRDLPAGATSATPNKVFAARFSGATQIWSAPVGISSPDPRFAREAALVADSTGNLTTLWVDSVDLIAARNVNGDWSQQVQIASPPFTPFNYDNLQARVDSRGNVTVLWSLPSKPSGIVYTRWLAGGAAGSPRALTARVSGTAVTFSWQPPTPAPGSYILEAGSRSGATDLAQIDTGSTTALTTGPVPPGTYYLRVRAKTGATVSAPSNEVTVVVPSGCQTPGVPTGMATSVAGQRVVLTWSAAPAAASYVLEVGSASGESNLFSGNVGSTTVFAAADVPAGQYFARARAVNACGVSLPSNEAIATVAGCQPPSAPTGFTASVSGGTVLLSWNATLTATSYVLEAGVAPGTASLFVGNVGSNPSLSATGVAAGRYYLRVRAVSSCGTSLPSTEAVADVVP